MTTCAPRDWLQQFPWAVAEVACLLQYPRQLNFAPPDRRDDAMAVLGEFVLAEGSVIVLEFSRLHGEAYMIAGSSPAECRNTGGAASIPSSTLFELTSSICEQR